MSWQLEIATVKLRLHSAARHVYAADGTEITATDDIIDGTDLWVCITPARLAAAKTGTSQSSAAAGVALGAAKARWATIHCNSQQVAPPSLLPNLNQSLELGNN